MAIWYIDGGNRLEGRCFVQGSKNSVLPMLAASVICGAETKLLNVPELSDVTASLDILRCLGCEAEQHGNDVYINSAGLSENTVPREKMQRMRSSVLFLGALLARCGEAHIYTPGGCKLGLRPIDLHLDVMKKLGAEVLQCDDEIICRAHKLKGTVIKLPVRSVGATENAMLAACGAEGKTEIHGAAMEPEIVDLQEYLRKLGAYIYGAGTDCIVINGFKAENMAGHRVIPDRIVASTILCACAACGGNVELVGVIPEHFSQTELFLNAAGCDIINGKRNVRIHSDGNLVGVRKIVTEPYPGFPTDVQPLLMAALLKSKGRTEFVENIFENRFAQAEELKKFGADICVSGNKAVLYGAEKLSPAQVKASDLRGGASLLIAAMNAEGRSVVSDNGLICRGYENFDIKLRCLGADITMEM